LVVGAIGIAMGDAAKRDMATNDEYGSMQKTGRIG